MAQTAGTDATGFTITSTTFKSDSKIPRIMRGFAKPQCYGGDQSPELSWTGSPVGTKSFAVVLFDVTANYGHWGIYNLASNAKKLPQHISPGNNPPHWLQVTDDAGVQGYFGPCPPPVRPFVHRYVFTIYALDTMLTLRKQGSLSGPTIETLFRAMIGHVLRRASITGLAASPKATSS
jgi:Raf kinase inhibitor-like YbhB/YbcL family protein